MSDEPAPSEETDPIAPVPEAASAKPERRRKEPKPPKTPEELLLAPSRSMQAWTTAFLLLSVVLLAAQVLRAADDFGNGPLGALLLAAVFAGLWVRSARDYTVLKDFVRHPESVFWIQCLEPAAWCELAPWRWLVRSRRLAFFTLAGARAETAVPVKRFDETVAWLRERNPAALDFRPASRSPAP